ncbi:hypothetical protein J6590_055870 [Homalodisca vitripennis]|nr:hypothetical protein J6590_055870 [Homalodisca vitripennis]
MVSSSIYVKAEDATAVNTTCLLRPPRPPRPPRPLQNVPVTARHALSLTDLIASPLSVSFAMIAFSSQAEIGNFPR